MSKAGYAHIVQRSVTLGTGPFELLPSQETTFKRFADVITTGDPVVVMIVNPGKNEWQECLCTFATGSPDTLTVLRVISSSAADNSAVTFTGGSKLVMLTASSFTLAAAEKLRPPVRCATTSTQTLASVIAGSSLDGLTLVAGDRVALLGQSTATEIGIYTIAVAGAPVRATDFAAGDSVSGAIIPILAGTYAGGYAFCTKASGSDVVGTSSLTWQLSGPGVWQPLDATLTALAALNSTGGVLCQTAADTFAKRTLQAPAAGFTITNPAGVAGDPTFVLANDLAALEGLSSTGIPARTASNTWAQRTLQAPAAGLTITNPAGVAGDPTFVLANDLAALEGLSSTGLAARTAADTWAQRTLQAPAAGFTITNPAGVAGDPTFVLANDLAALEGLSSTGLAVRTGSDTWAQRTITGTAGAIAVTNGNGVSGNPTLDFDLTDITTYNATTSRHGLLPKLPNVSTQIIDGVGSWRALAAADLGTTMQPQFTRIGLGTAANSSFLILGDAGASGALVRLVSSGAATSAGLQLICGASGQIWVFAANAANSDAFNVTDNTAGAVRLSIDTAGRTGFGITAATTISTVKVDARSTTLTQLAASYDASNYLGVSVSSSGLATIAGAGSSKGLVLSDGIQAGTGAGRAKVGGVLANNATAANNSGTSETDLHSVTVVGNTLANDRESLRVRMSFSAAANANQKRVRIKWGATTVLDTGLWAANGSILIADVEIIRTGAATQLVNVELKTSGGGWTSAFSITTAAETLSTSTTLKATGQSDTASSDVTQRWTQVEWRPAN